MIAALIGLALALPPATPRAPQADLRCQAQEALTSAPLFVACARAATDKYHDRSIAILDGYRQIGGDFPAMGEHWMRIGLVFDQRFDPSRPEVLTYVVIDGTPRLVGVAYAMGLLAGEHPPEGPGGAHAWHDHSKSVGQETTQPHHHHGGSAATGSRIAMMHAWIWSPNPDGMFAADNWAIPFLRLGLEPPANAPVDAAKALSLVSGGRNYFENAIADAARLSEMADVTRALDRAHAAASRIAAGLNGTLPPESASALAGIWSEMWSTIDAALSAETRQRVHALPIR